MTARGPACPSELDLHRLVAGEGEASALAARRAHADGCARCRERVAALEGLKVPSPSPDFWAQLAQPEVRPRGLKRWTAGLASLLALGALGAAVLAVRLSRPDEVRTKGGLALDLVVRRASGRIDHLASGGIVAPGETFRFELAHATGGFPMIVGLDARPSVTVYAAGRAALAVAGQTLLPEAVVADDTPGVERIVALVCPTEVSSAALEAEARRALAAAGGRPADVGALALACEQASVLVEKRAP